MASERSGTQSRPYGRSLKDFEPLSLAETKLIELTACGDECKLGTSVPESATDDNRIRGEVLRFLALGGDDKTPVHEKGVRLRGAAVTGVFDIQGADLPAGLSFLECRFSETINLGASRARTINLDGSCLFRLTADDVRLNGSLILRRVHAEGGARLRLAEVSGNLECDGGHFKNPDGVALDLTATKISGNVLLREFGNRRFKSSGTVRLLGASIGGSLECDGGLFEKSDGQSFNFERAHIGGSVFLRSAGDQPFTARGTVRFLNARIGGNLECVGGLFENGTGVALNAWGAKIGGAVLLCNDFHAEGEVRLFGAEVGGNLECVGGNFKNGMGVALNAEGMKIGGAVLLRNNFRAEGEVRLFGAEVGGSLVCDAGSFKSSTGRALIVERTKIGGAVLLRNNFRAEGEVRLFGSEVGTNLECDAGSFKNGTGRALTAEGTKIGGAVLLRNNFHAEGEVRLLRATIGGDLIIGGDPKFVRADLVTGAGAKLIMQRTDIKGVLDIVGMRAGANTMVNFNDTSCNVLIDDIGESWPPEGKLVLDGFVYRRINNPGGPDVRLGWIRRQLPRETKERRGRFRPQPYRQLAGVLRAQGLDAEAKAILIGMAEDRRKWADLDWYSRAWQWVLWITIRNGHQPLRAMYGLLILWVVGFLAFGWGYQTHVIVPSDRFAFTDLAEGRALPGQYDPFCALAYAIDTSLPIISFGQRERWTQRAHPPI